MMNKFKMDKIGINSEIYKSIFFATNTIFLIIFEIYIMLAFNGINILNFESISNDTLRIILQILAQIISFSAIYAILHKIVFKIKSLIWIKQNKEIWLQGIWLHVHEKKDIRVGIVKIKQNFYEIEAQAQNINPSMVDNDKITDWYYSMARVSLNEKDESFVGYYKTHKHDVSENNDGMHRLIVTSRKNGYPCIMRGNFYDTVHPNNNEYEIKDHCGKLTFFKPSKECLKALNDNSSMLKAVQNLPNDYRFKGEEYVVHLKNTIEKYNSVQMV